MTVRQRVDTGNFSTERSVDQVIVSSFPLVGAAKAKVKTTRTLGSVNERRVMHLT